MVLLSLRRSDAASHGDRARRARDAVAGNLRSAALPLRTFRNQRPATTSSEGPALFGSFSRSAAAPRLNKSPRHSEWVDLKHGDRTVKAFVEAPALAL